jgi:hypothetical protein
LGNVRDADVAPRRAAEDPHVASGRGEDTSDHLEKRALPGAVRAHDRKEVTGVKAERDPLERRPLPVADADLDELEGRSPCFMRDVLWVEASRKADPAADAGRAPAAQGDPPRAETIARTS